MYIRNCWFYLHIKTMSVNFGEGNNIYIYIYKYNNFAYNKAMYLTDFVR